MHLLIFSVNCVSKKTSVVVFLFVVNYFETIVWRKFHINSFPLLNLVSCFGASSLFKQWRLQQHLALKLSCLFRNHSYEHDQARNNHHTPAKNSCNNSFFYPCFITKYLFFIYERSSLSKEEFMKRWSVSELR